MICCFFIGRRKKINYLKSRARCGIMPTPEVEIMRCVLVSIIRMAADRVRCGYPRISGPRVLVLGPDFRPRFCGFGYPKYRGFGADLELHPRISIGPRNIQPISSPTNNPRYITWNPSLLPHPVIPLGHSHPGAALPQSHTRTPHTAFRATLRHGDGGTPHPPTRRATPRRQLGRSALVARPRDHVPRPLSVPHGAWPSAAGGRRLPSSCEISFADGGSLSPCCRRGRSQRVHPLHR
jgi:hypothetical protein